MVEVCPAPLHMAGSMTQTPVSAWQQSPIQDLTRLNFSDPMGTGYQLAMCYYMIDLIHVYTLMSPIADLMHLCVFYGWSRVLWASFQFIIYTSVLVCFTAVLFMPNLTWGSYISRHPPCSRWSPWPRPGCREACLPSGLGYGTLHPHKCPC